MHPNTNITGLDSGNIQFYTFLKRPETKRIQIPEMYELKERLQKLSKRLNLQPSSLKESTQIDLSCDKFSPRSA